MPGALDNAVLTARDRTRQRLVEPELEFNTYLDQEHADPFADSVGYIQVPLWLSEDELAGLIDEVRSALVARRDNEATPDRSPYLASPILFPLERPVSRTARAGPSS